MGRQARLKRERKDKEVVVIASAGIARASGNAGPEQEDTKENGYGLDCI